MSDSELDSDFADEMVEYDVDSDGNPIGAKQGVSRGDSVSNKPETPKEPEDPEARKKKKRLEKLDSKIKSLTKKHEKEGGVKMQHPSDIKNKHKRQEIVLKKRMADARETKLERLKKKKLREEFGEEAAPRQVPKTIESMRVKDETMITELDEDIKGEQNVDEFASYFNRDTKPRIVMTTNRRPRGGIFNFMKEIKAAFPGCEYYERKNFLIKNVIEWAKERGFTDLMLWYEKHGKPHTLILSHLPKGPTATFRVSGVMLREQIPNHGAAPGDVHPELIMNNFDTMLGHRIGRMLASLVP